MAEQPENTQLEDALNEYRNACEWAAVYWSSCEWAERREAARRKLERLENAKVG